jgi:hypothetical protein
MRMKNTLGSSQTTVTVVPFQEIIFNTTAVRCQIWHLRMFRASYPVPLFAHPNDIWRQHNHYLAWSLLQLPPLSHSLEVSLFLVNFRTNLPVALLFQATAAGDNATQFRYSGLRYFVVRVLNSPRNYVKTISALISKSHLWRRLEPRHEIGLAYVRNWVS